MSTDQITANTTKGAKRIRPRNRTAHDGWRDNSKHALKCNKSHFWDIRTFHDAILCAHKTNFIEATNNTMYIVTKKLMCSL